MTKLGPEANRPLQGSKNKIAVVIPASFEAVSLRLAV